MLVELSSKALNDIRSWYQEGEAIDKLETLYKETGDAIEKKLGQNYVDTIHNVLDLSIRRLTEELSWKMQKEKVSPTEIGVSSLIDLSIEGAIKKFLLNSAPYKILEDLMEGQTIKTCEILWNLLEERKNKLTTSIFIPSAGKNTKASLCLLRLCNALLRRLSKSQDTVFCGRILVFLSFTFALSERSAVNLGGKSNVNNLTEFEDEDTFKIAETTDIEAESNSDAASMEVDVPDSISSNETPIDYNFYRIFWNIQRFFRKCNLATESAQNWDSLFEELDTVLAALEGNAFSTDDLDRSKERRNALIPDGETDKQRFFQPKYLTNSRLLRLQLRDPLLRQSLLTQFLVLFNNLSKCKAPSNVKTSKSKIPSYHDRVVSLLNQTPPDGDEFAEMVSHVLERERNWVKWKMDKCPPYEREPSKDLFNTKRKRIESNKPTFSGISSKRKSTGKDLVQRMISNPQNDEILVQLKGIERDSEVKYKELLERFTDAWDPENGIEKEYWPNNDKMHCWRTMRSIWKYEVTKMQHAPQGINELVRSVTGVKKPENEENNDEANIEKEFTEAKNTKEDQISKNSENEASVADSKSLNENSPMEVDSSTPKTKKKIKQTPKVEDTEVEEGEDKE